MSGGENEEWKHMHINDWLLSLNAGILSHAFVSPFGIFEIRMEINRCREGRVPLRIRNPGNHSAINIMAGTSDEIEGNLDPMGYRGEQKRISDEIHDPSIGYLRGKYDGVSGERRCFTAQLGRMGICAI